MQSSTPQVSSDQVAPLLASIVREFEGLVNQLCLFAARNPQADFVQLEQRARQLHEQCFSSALQAAAQLHRASIEEEWLVGKAQCECGHIPQYKGKQRRTLQTWVGTVTLERGYFYCKRCGTGRYPLDEALALCAGEHFSDGVQQGVCLLGAQLPFEQACAAMEMLTDISVSPREAQRMTEQRGLALEESLQAEELALLKGEIGSASASASASASDGVWAVALDAGNVRYKDGWHEAKVGVVFRAEAMLDEQGEVDGGRATHGSQSYIAECGSMEEAGMRLAAEACRRGIGPEERVVCLGDGAPANWKQFDEHFPNRVEVLDWYHAVRQEAA